MIVPKSKKRWRRLSGLTVFNKLREFYINIKRSVVKLTVFLFARHGRALTGESPEHAQIVGSV